MARFDVHRFDSKTTPLVVIVQSDLFDDFGSRVVIPLAPESTNKSEAQPKLKPVVKVKGKKYVLRTTDIAAIETRELGPLIDNLEDRYRQTITDAMDFLFQGF